MFTIDDLIAAIEAAKANGKVTGSSPVTVINFEGNKSHVSLAIDARVVPAGEVPEPSFMIDFEG